MQMRGLLLGRWGIFEREKGRFIYAWTKGAPFVHASYVSKL
jgi:hypothetical protein